MSGRWPLSQSEFAIAVGLATASLVGVLCAVAPPAHAQSLNEALTIAYQGSPPLNAQRASARATDENVPQALSQWRPTVTVTGQAGYTQTDVTVGNLTSRRRLHPDTETLTVTQPVYTGGRDGGADRPSRKPGAKCPGRNHCGRRDGSRHRRRLIYGRVARPGDPRAEHQ